MLSYLDFSAHPYVLWPLLGGVLTIFIGLIIDSLVRAYKTFDPDPLLYIEEVRNGQPCLTVVRRSDYIKHGTF